MNDNLVQIFFLLPILDLSLVEFFMQPIGYRVLVILVLVILNLLLVDLFGLTRIEVVLLILQEKNLHKKEC